MGSKRDALSERWTRNHARQPRSQAHRSAGNCKDRTTSRGDGSNRAGYRNSAIMAIIKLRRRYADKRTMAERRSEVRMMCADPGGSLLEKSSGENQKGPSGTGRHLRIRSLPATGEPRAPGSRAALALAKTGVRGRYCVYREIGYFVGVHFDPASQWSKANYRPQHLLDPTRLLGRRGATPKH
jgi:hypothetical protein